MTTKAKEVPAEIMKILRGLEPSSLILFPDPKVFSSIGSFSLIKDFYVLPNDRPDWKTRSIRETETLVYLETVEPMKEFRELTPMFFARLIQNFNQERFETKEKAPREDWMPNQPFYKFIIAETMDPIYIEECILVDLFKGKLDRDQPFRFELI